MRKFVASEDTDVKEFSDNSKIVYYVKHIDEFYANDGSINIQYHLYGLITENVAKQGLCFELEDIYFMTPRLVKQIFKPRKTRDYK